MGGAKRSELTAPSVAWLIAGDRGGVFGRSMLVAGIGALAWSLGLSFAEQRLLPSLAVPPRLAERLLLDIEEDAAGRIDLSALFGRIPAIPTVPPDTLRAIRDAAEDVGVDAGYLIAVAARESGFNPAARAKTTTAVGLYQFTDMTWLKVVKVFGAQHGLADYAALIAIGENGQVTMRNAAARRTLMDLRLDPLISAVMAAELARDNESKLEHVLGRPVTPGEIYIAHFLGLGQATKIIAEAYARPRTPAAELMPAAAENNPGVFGERNDSVSAAAMVAKIEAYFAREVPRFAGL
jgi:hypothetical protein